jgi:hypothetical protein
MRKPETVEKLYLDFDGFFASVMHQTMPRLRGKPVGPPVWGIEAHADGGGNKTGAFKCKPPVKQE